MSDIARVIIAAKTCLLYDFVGKLQAKSAFTCNVCQGLNTTLCDVTYRLVSNLPLKSCECYILFSDVTTTPLYNITMMFYRGVVTTSPTGDVTVMSY